MHDTTDRDLVEAGIKAEYYLNKETGLEAIQEFEPEEAARPDSNKYAEISEPMHVPDVNLHLKAANIRAGLDVDAYLNISAVAELAIPREMYKYVSSEIDELAASGPQQPYDHELVVLALSGPTTGARTGEGRVYQVNKKIIIERDTDLLTQDELENIRMKLWPRQFPS